MGQDISQEAQTLLQKTKNNSIFNIFSCFLFLLNLYVLLFSQAPNTY